MPKITFVEFNGTEHILDVAEGLTLMDAATKNSIPGIDADCGGACACATCMIYVPAEWKDRLGEIEAMEETMLDFCEHSTENSRLSCQIKVSADMDGLRVTMPESQH